MRKKVIRMESIYVIEASTLPPAFLHCTCGDGDDDEVEKERNRWREGGDDAGRCD